jgi:hypothetical protein
MNWAHLHLITNHFPILGAFLITALMALSLWKKDKQLLTLTFQMMILIGILTLPAYFTGEPSEELIEHLPGVSESVINKHENAALYGLIVTELLAVAGIVGLILLRRNLEKAFTILKPLLFLGVLDIFLMAWIANLGGEIRHSEIRNTSLSTVQNKNHSERSDDHSENNTQDRD